MLTDATPRKANRAAFLESDRIRTLDLPQDGCLLPIAKCIESAMKNGTSADVSRACAEFLNAASGFYKVPACGIRVLAARPLRVRELGGVRSSAGLSFTQLGPCKRLAVSWAIRGNLKAGERP
jgi:hypothetical protein